MKFLDWFKPKFKYLNKKIICFSEHGCMATQHEFEWIGIIKEKVYSNEGSLFYNVQILKDKTGELRDGNLKQEFEKIPSWYIQDLENKTLIIYK